MLYLHISVGRPLGHVLQYPRTRRAWCQNNEDNFGHNQARPMVVRHSYHSAHPNDVAVPIVLLPCIVPV